MKKIIILMLLLVSQVSYSQWEAKNNGLGRGAIVALTVDGDKIYAGLCGGGVGIYMSSDMGESWVNIESQKCINAVFIIDGNIFVVVENYSDWVFFSSDMGKNWINRSNGLPESGEQLLIRSLANINNKIFVGTSKGIFMTTNNGDIWVDKNTGLPVNNKNVTSMITIGNSIFATVWDSGLFMSSDMGDHWININNDSAILHVSSRMVVDENIIFVGTAFGGVYLSTDMGNSWINESEELPSCMVFALAVKGDYIFASLSCTARMVLSTNMGNTWAVRMKGFADTTGDVYAFAILGDYIFAGTDGGGVYRAKISDLVLDVKEDDPAPVDIYFYPNPVSDYLYIDISAEFEPVQSIEIYDQLGRLLKNIPSNSLATHTLSIFVGDLSPSIYFLKIQKHGSYIYKKFIKI